MKKITINSILIYFETGKATIIKAFEKILPDKCSFEI